MVLQNTKRVTGYQSAVTVTTYIHEAKRSNNATTAHSFPCKNFQGLNLFLINFDRFRSFSKNLVFDVTILIHIHMCLFAKLDFARNDISWSHTLKNN